jgi:hypothetical protein
MNATWRIIALDPEKRIGGVWRLTDNKKFYVGDPTPDGRIEGFQVHQGSIPVLMCKGGHSLNVAKK